MPSKKNIKKKPLQRSEQQKIEESWQAALTQLHNLTKKAALVEIKVERLREIVEPSDDDSDHSNEYVEMTELKLEGINLGYDQLYLLGRAKTKFDHFDIDKSGTLGSDEVLELADWVWNNFEPDGEPLTQSQRLNLANKLLEKYDDDGDGMLSFEEFVDWFLETHEFLEEAKNSKFEDVEDHEQRGFVSAESVVQAVFATGENGSMRSMTLKEAIRKAREKYAELDRDKSGLLEGNECTEIANWSLKTFQPGGQKITDLEHDEYCDILLEICDANGDKKVDFDEFAEWFVGALVDIAKTNKLLQDCKNSEVIILYYQSQPLTLKNALSKVRVKFRELDEDLSNFLEGQEVEMMGEWVWKTFAPNGRFITDKKRNKITRNLIAQRDLNQDSRLDFDEFSRWFVDTCQFVYMSELDKSIRLREFDRVSVNSSQDRGMSGHE